MPRKAKEKIEEVKEEKVKKEPKTKKVASKKTSTSTKKAEIKTDTKTKKVATKKTPSKKDEKEVSKVSKETKSTKTSKVSKTPKATKSKTTTKTTAKSTKKEPKEKSSVEKKVATTKKSTSTKKTTAKKASSVKKATTKKSTTKKSTSTKKEPAKTRQTKKKVEILEYYDLPYRYNQTVVKLLAQTPTTLFVYWDISDEDRNKYIEQYGEYFFHNTKPVLIITNKTKNYSFEIDINDFANSWYFNITDSDCDYQVELGRRPINNYVSISNDYLYITTSNQIESPNDRILFDKLSHFVYFRNVKTNETIKKHTSLSLLSKIGKISSVSEFYKKLYPEEAIDFDRLDLVNPSSGNPTSSFK